MLNISKYHRTIVGCSAIATTSFCGFVQSASAAEQFNYRNVRIDPSSTLIAGQNIGSGGNKSNASGVSVGNGTGIPIGSGGNKSNATGINVGNNNEPNVGGGPNKSNGTGINVGNNNNPTIGSGGNKSNATGVNVGNSRPGISSRGFSSGAISRANNISNRFSIAQGNYDKAALALAQAEASQPTASSTSPVRYAREVGDLASCGCPNADVVGTNNSPRPELVAAKAAEAEAAAELAAAKAEAREFLESVKGNNTSVSSGISSPLW